MVASEARSLTWLFCSVSWLKAVTASGVSCTKVLRRVAVTTMRSIWPAAGAGASWAASSTGVACCAMAAPLPNKINWANVTWARLLAMVLRVGFFMMCLLYLPLVG